MGAEEALANRRREAENALGATATNDEEKNAEKETAEEKAAEKHDPVRERKER